MRVTFVLPGYRNHPIGGYRVVYEYANRLHDKGHYVTVILPSLRSIWSLGTGNVARRYASELLWSVKASLNPCPVTWFPLRPGIRLWCVPEVANLFMPGADAIVAAGSLAVEAVARLGATKGAKLGLVYDYEYWMSGDPSVQRRIANAYHQPFRLIATSPAVVEMLSEIGSDACAYVTCGVDLDKLAIDIPIEQRSPYIIGFPYRPEPFKGAADAVQALALLRHEYGERVRALAFGVTAEPALPDWVEYEVYPSDEELRRFYNKIGIFLYPSHYEGWGLPGMEALACGAALVAADSVGLRDYARHGETAVLVGRQRPDLLAGAIEMLGADDSLRQRLARRGRARVQQYTWGRAVDALEAVLIRESNRSRKH
jgi:glycosyltransferase involved in cell wall biosynthesis